MIIHNLYPKVLHNLHKNGIYLFTHVGEGDLMKNFQKIGNEKRALRLLQFI